MLTRKALLLLPALLLVVTTSLQAEPHYFEVRYEASTQAGELQIGVTHTLWIPSGVKTVRGVIVHQHGCGVGACGNGTTAAYDLHWQALARKWDCALLGPSYHQAAEQNCRLWCDPRNGSDKVFLKALDDLAEKSGHPEVATAPWCLWGHSGGGFWASLMQMLYPQRIVAIWFQSGTAFGYWEKGEIEKPKISAAALQIPMMANPGVKERGHERFRKAWDGNLAMFKAYRAKGATIAFTPDPATGHDTGDSRYLSIPFFDVCLSVRLPKEQGGALNPMDASRQWLCELEGDQPTPAGEFKGDPLKACWLPDEQYAKAWSEFVKTGRVSDNTPPPPPTNLKIARRPDGGVALSWKANADFESGIRAFIVKRNGKEVGRLPKQPKKKPYRNLFQGKTYGDTPVPPLAKMEFVDEGGNTGDNYEVITINSVGQTSASP